MMIKDKYSIGIIGSGAMGSGIAQVAAMAGHIVYLYDKEDSALQKSKDALHKILKRLEEKGRIGNSEEIMNRFKFIKNQQELGNCQLIIEAIVENLDIKKSVFKSLESIVDPSCILATNTSSLSIASIAGACQNPERVIGIHFFNPAPLMDLVEIIPAIQTEHTLPEKRSEEHTSELQS